MSTVPFIGTLTDEDIRAYCSRKKLIVSGYEEANVEQACYELRASRIYYELGAGKQKHELTDGEFVLIKPKQSVVVITLEELCLPNDILGRILTKGMLFSVGLLPVNTYADPGFSGQLGIVFHNVSNNFLKIIPGDAIAKIEFSKLHAPVATPYRGQHGYHTKIWPIPEDVILSIEDAQRDPRIKPIPEEIELAYGRDIGTVMKRIYTFERRLLLAGLMYFLFTMVLLAIGVWGRTNWVSPILSVGLGVGTNVLTTVLTGLATSFDRRTR